MRGTNHQPLKGLTNILNSLMDSFIQEAPLSHSLKRVGCLGIAQMVFQDLFGQGIARFFRRQGEKAPS